MNACVKIFDGSGFFAAKHYILTCYHVLPDNKVGIDETVQYVWRGKEYSAKVADLCKKEDLALLYVEEPPKSCRHLKLDRVAVPGMEARLYGYPSGERTRKNTCVLIGEEEVEDRFCLDKANNAVKGFSGGPLVPTAEDGVAVGIFTNTNNPTDQLRGIEAAGMISVEPALELWGDKLEELRYTVVRHERNPFVYNSLQTDYIDQGGKLKELKNFIASPQQICWWSIVAEGGAGKSRLAYELAHSLTSCWRCHLLQPDDLKADKLNTLLEAAGRDLLLIANYAYTDTGELGAWLDGIIASARENKSYHRIRVLLLQRRGKDDQNIPWRQSLLFSRRLLEEHRFKEEDLTLERPEEQQLTEIMRSYAANRGGALDAAACKRLYQVLADVDESFMRPLFAMFITDAFLDKKEPFDWDPEKALNHFCLHEQTLLDKAVGPSMARAAKTLWVLSTISHAYRLSPDTLPKVVARQARGVAPEELGDALVDAGLAREAGDAWILDPMTPDPLGEYFVLKHFEGNRTDILEILSAAFNQKPRAVSDFLTRMFADLPAKYDIIEACCQGGEQMAAAVSWGLVRLPDPDSLKTLYENRRSDLWLEQYARSLFNSFNHQLEPERIKTLARLLVLYRDHSNNGVVAGQYSNALCNHFLSQSDPQMANKCLEQLRSIYEAQRAVNGEIAKNVAVPYAKGLVNYLSRDFSPARADEIVGRLDKLYGENEFVDEVVVWFAKGLFSYFRKQSDLTQAFAVIERLRVLYEQLREEHRKLPDVAVQYAWGLYNYFIMQAKDDRDETLERLRALHEANPINSKVAVMYARALFDLFCAQNEPELAKELFVRLRNLYSRIRDLDIHSDHIAVMYAREIFLLLSCQSDSECAAKILLDVRELYEECDCKEKVAVWYAKSIFHLLSLLTETKRVDSRLQQMRNLYEEVHSGEVAVWYSKGLCNYIIPHAKDKRKGKQILEILSLLASNHEEAQRYYSLGRMYFSVKFKTGL